MQVKATTAFVAFALLFGSALVQAAPTLHADEHNNWEAVEARALEDNNLLPSHEQLSKREVGIDWNDNDWEKREFVEDGDLEKRGIMQKLYDWRATRHDKKATKLETKAATARAAAIKAQARADNRRGVTPVQASSPEAVDPVAPVGPVGPEDPEII